MDTVVALILWCLSPDHLRGLSLFAVPGVVATGIAIGLSAASAAAGYIGSRKAASAQEQAARDAAAALNIPFYGPGERITKQTAKWLAGTYTGEPIHAMPTAGEIASGPLADTVAPVSNGSGAHFLAARSGQSRAGFDVAGKKFNTTMGERYGDLTSNALIGQQGAKTNFQNWQDRGYMDILRSTPPSPDPAQYLVPLASSLGRIGYNWYQDREAQQQNKALNGLSGGQGGDYALMPTEW